MNVKTPGNLAPSLATLSYDGTVLHRKSREHRMLSGSVHYFRVHPAQWEDRLRRLAAMGANTVDTYIPWNFHEEVEGAPQFDGWRDVEAYIRLAGEIGLDVYVRPSPYICAEWSNGGLPSWLTGRTRGVRTSDPEFLRAVDSWYEHLLPRLAPLQAVHGGPIVAFQIENEYGSFGSDRHYLEHLRDLVHSHGIVELLTTADGTTEDMVRYGSIDGAMPTFTFGTGVQAAQNLLPNATPLLCSELWGGWFDHWGERHHVRHASSTAATVEELLDAGGSVSLYMAHGGTNFELWNGANWNGALQPTVTSYDSDAPIAEDGRITAKFEVLKELFAPFHDRPLPELPAAPKFQEPRSERLSPAVSLIAAARSLPAGEKVPRPLTFEELGVSDGIVVYESVVDIPESTTLTIEGLHDRAVVFLNGERLGTLERDGATSLVVGESARSAVLTVVVESLGRINYGAKLGERKGILDGVLLGRRLVHGWIHRVLPLNGQELAGEAGVDGFARAEFDLPEAADAWLAFPGSTRGMVWVNGFLIGRYFNVGPQETLYAPAPLWRVGRNEVSVLDLDRLGDVVEVRDQASLGEVEEFIGS